MGRGPRLRGEWSFVLKEEAEDMTSWDREQVCCVCQGWEGRQGRNSGWVKERLQTGGALLERRLARVGVFFYPSSRRGEEANDG